MMSRFIFTDCLTNAIFSHRELAFNKGDVVFIRRQIDKNWYEGESRGQVGIFPCNYVEVRHEELFRNALNTSLS